MNEDSLHPLAIIALTIWLNSVFFVLATWAFARLVGASVAEVVVGMGPSVERMVGDVRVRLGAVPLNGYVTMRGMLPGDAYAGDDSWRKLGFVERVVVRLGPWLVSLLLTMALLTPARAVRSFAHALPQLFSSLDLTPLVEGYFRIANHEPIQVAIGVLLAKSAAVNMLPFAFFTAGGVITDVRRELTGREEMPASWIPVSTIVVFFGVVLRVVIGVVRASL